MLSPRPVDMTVSHTSPPPLTKLVHRKPSSPREFFEKLYGPDTTKEESRSSPAPTSPAPDTAKVGERENSVTANVNNNFHGSFARTEPTPSGGSESQQPILSSSYLPAFPLPPHEVGLLSCNLDNVPFPGGLAAFCKYFDTPHIRRTVGVEC